MKTSPDNYGTREACQRLQKAGIVIEADMYWVKFSISGWSRIAAADAIFVELPNPVPALSMAEAWRELPNFIDKGTHRYRKTIYADGGTTCCWFSGLGESICRNTNPTDALINLIIWTEGQQKEGKA